MLIKNILITGRLYKEIKEILEKSELEYNIRYLNEKEIKEADLYWADAFASFRPSPLFDLSTLKWVHSFGAGVDSFLFNKKWDENILLTRTVCSFGQKISEYCLSYILSDLQFHQEFDQHQTQKKWEQVAPRPLHQQTVFIYGTGTIGQEIAKLLSLLKMTVYGVSLSGKQKDHFKTVYSGSVTGPLNDANFVINTLPLTRETNHLFNKDIFELLNRAVFINVGRGATVDKQSMVEALEKGYLKHAVLDVFSEEPLSKYSPLWDRRDVTITPHISALTSPEEAVTCFLNTLQKIELGEPLTNQVNIKKGF